MKPASWKYTSDLAALQRDTSKASRVVLILRAKLANSELFLKPKTLPPPTYLLMEATSLTSRRE